MSQADDRNPDMGIFLIDHGSAVTPTTLPGSFTLVITNAQVTSNPEAKMSAVWKYLKLQYICLVIP